MIVWSFEDINRKHSLKPGWIPVRSYDELAEAIAGRCGGYAMKALLILECYGAVMCARYGEHSQSAAPAKPSPASPDAHSCTLVMMRVCDNPLRPVRVTAASSFSTWPIGQRCSPSPTLSAESPCEPSSLTLSASQRSQLRLSSRTS